MCNTIVSEDSANNEMDQLQTPPCPIVGTAVFVDVPLGAAAAAVAIVVTVVVVGFVRSHRHMVLFFEWRKMVRKVKNPRGETRPPIPPVGRMMSESRWCEWAPQCNHRNVF